MDEEMEEGGEGRGERERKSILILHLLFQTIRSIEREILEVSMERSQPKLGISELRVFTEPSSVDVNGKDLITLA